MRLNGGKSSTSARDPAPIPWIRKRPHGYMQMHWG